MMSAVYAGERSKTLVFTNWVLDNDKAYADLAFGEGHGITPHSLRHTDAMNAITGGASVIEVSRLLRHKNMRVTTIYVQHVSYRHSGGVLLKMMNFEKLHLQSFAVFNFSGRIDEMARPSQQLSSIEEVPK